MTLSTLRHNVNREQAEAGLGERLREYAESRSHSVYPPTIFVALGGTGAKSLLNLRQMIMERFGRVDALPGVAWLSLDTDITSTDIPADDERGKNPFASQIRFRENERLNLKTNFSAYLGQNLSRNPHIRDWWDPSFPQFDDFNIEKGAGQIRPLARLVFFSNRDAILARLRNCYGQVTAHASNSPRLDISNGVRIVVVAGLGGGTGSGIFLDMAALIKSAGLGQVSVDGIFVLPEVFRSVEKSMAKVQANGYAAIREINHYLNEPFTVRWTAHSEPRDISGLYDRYVVFSAKNVLGRVISTPQDCYWAIAQALFIGFSAGQLPGYVEGVRINRKQYINGFLSYQYQNNGVATHADRWRTALSTFGISKLVFPSWRLLNQARYDLAAEMVQMLDPARSNPLGPEVAPLRDRMLRDLNIFQGSYPDPEGGSTSLWQVRDRLLVLKGNTLGAGNIFEHVDRLRQELVDLAPSMYVDKSTREDANTRWREVDALIQISQMDDEQGDWVRAIRSNARILRREFEDRLPELIAQYADRPGIGPSGVMQILRAIVEQLSRPASTQARYGDWFRQQVSRQDENAKEARAAWEQRLNVAEQTTQGLLSAVLSTESNHRRAVELLALEMQNYLQARVKQVLCEEAAKVMDDIVRLIREQLDSLERLTELIFNLETHFTGCRDFYKTPMKSVLFLELPIPESVGDPLVPYLGNNSAERKISISNLLERTLRRNNLNSLTSLRDAVQKGFDNFRELVSFTCFQALHGNDDGMTIAFSSDEDPRPVQGFIQRYSALRMLKATTQTNDRLAERIRELYRRALPQVEIEALAERAVNYKPVPDIFIGYVVGDEGTIDTQIQKAIKEFADQDYPLRQRVEIKDPSEIIIYTELSGFPAFQIGDIHGDDGMRVRYEELRTNPANPMPLHIHQDYHTFQPIVPFDEREVARRTTAWRAFIQAQMLGIIRSVQYRERDMSRVGFQRRVQLSSNQVDWTDLGPELTVIEKLSRISSSLLQELQKQIENAQLRYLEKGRWPELITLIEYYYFCIFPSIRERELMAAGVDMALGSLQNLVCGQLREEWRAKAVRQLNETEDMIEVQAVTWLENEIPKRLQNMHAWTVPISRATNVIPMSDPVPAEYILQEWGPRELVDRAVNLMIDKGAIPEFRDDIGERRLRYPRLAVRWSKQEMTEAAPPVGDLRYIYNGPTGQFIEPRLSVEEVVEKIMADPKKDHYVWIEGQGLKNWSPYHTVDEIREAVRQKRRESQQAVETEVRYLYEHGGDVLRDLSAEDVARHMARAPNARHRVWADGMKHWVDADSVEEITQHLSSTPPGVGAPPPALPPDAPPSDDGPELYYDHNGTGARQVTAREIAASVAKHPNDRHRVYHDGRWQDAADVADVADRMPKGPPPDTAPPPDLLPGAPPPDEEPVYYYSHNKGANQQRTLREIASLVHREPRARHRVYYQDRWQDAADVPAIRALLPSGPPPDDGI